MSVTSSFPCLKIPTCSSSSSSSCTSSSTASYSFRFSSSKPYAAVTTTIRNSQTEGPLRRPVRESSSVPQPLKPTTPSQPPPPVPPPQKAATVVGDDKNGVTLEFQRQKAKELQEYFRQKKLEQAEQGPLFGFIGKNEINNGRWAMFGFAVGMLTEYATGSDFVDQVGQGTYSNVYKALDRDTGEIVALKKVRFNTSEPESIKFMAREIMILQRLDHPNVVKLKGLATSRMQYSIYLVFDFMQTDLARIIARPEERLTEPQVKCYMHQLLSGLQHCHDRGILHRDVKGSNLLIDKNGMLKIADFGLANYYNPNHNQPLTNRVVTLWYRAPELLLGATDYGVGIDLWSAGCVLAEMFTGFPIMPGRTEVEQIHRIFRLCGTPSEEYWRKLKLSTTFRPPKSYRPSFVETFRDIPPSSLGLLCTLLALDPAFRGSASKALKNQFFFTSPLACDLSALPVIYRGDDELYQVKEQIKYMNSKIRRSRTFLEQRKNLASKKLIEHSVSSKEELRRNAEPEHGSEPYVPSEELGSTTTSSTSSSVNPTGSKDHSPFFLSPFLASDQKPSPKIHHHANVGENIRNLPPLPKSKPKATKKDDNRYRSDHVFRSTSTREFRNFKREEPLFFEMDN